MGLCYVGSSTAVEFEGQAAFERFTAAVDTAKRPASVRYTSMTATKSLPRFGREHQNCHDVPNRRSHSSIVLCVLCKLPMSLGSYQLPTMQPLHSVAVISSLVI